ncbi:MAG: peptidoglycan bridge formation glycyltransferase FemA/FemB family protein [bacterium]|nr:peptidoglycan bridge formation glycyltransferase FemA/FemB family protein [bacterium]
MRAVLSYPNKKEWNAFVEKNGGSFLQSFQWGELHSRVEKGVIYCCVKEGESTILQALVTRWTFPLGTHLAIFLGPVVSRHATQSQYKEAMKVLVQELSLEAKKEKDVFLRVEPARELPSEISWEVPVRRVQPSCTRVLDLSLSYEEVYANFHKNTRYSARTAEKKGVRISSISGYDPSFFKLLKKTATRQRFYSHKESYYKELCKTLKGDVESRLFLAKKEDRVVAVAIVVFAFSRATLLHAASDYEARDLLAPHLLQAKIIQEAKERGCVEYDFWGVDNEKYAGTSLFKKRFGGQEMSYPIGGELPFSNVWYTIYKSVRKFRRIFSL